jgi:hypothetical protein
MTGGFVVNVRGFAINIADTLDQYYYVGERADMERGPNDFENYLRLLKLKGHLDDYEEGKKSGFNEEKDGLYYPNGFVLSSVSDAESEGDSLAYLATGFWAYQYWVVQAWSDRDRKIQHKFTDDKYFTKKIIKDLKSKWEDKLVLVEGDEDYELWSVTMEWYSIYY